VTPLERLIAEAIVSEGPMRLDRYMALCLGHPEHGYYMSRDPFGARGDFITAPEISQVFGELIGVWCAAAWAAMGAPDPFNLIELGPGRGTLMSDTLRAAKVMPGFREAALLHLVETSPVLRRRQEDKLGAATWHDSVAGPPDGPCLVIANEFFDALPIRQFERRDGRWMERVIGLEAGHLALGLIDACDFNAQGADSNIIEFSPARAEVAFEIGRRLARHPGAALIIDYGHVQSAPGDTLQALRGHRFVPVTQAPGECDLTSHVDRSAGQGLGQGRGHRVAGSYPTRFPARHGARTAHPHSDGENRCGIAWGAGTGADKACGPGTNG
jgi:NADH dehydrogenase [ubiquinone] 1 alpha subcomplex assembly factor 7